MYLIHVFSYLCSIVLITHATISSSVSQHHWLAFFYSITHCEKIRPREIVRGAVTFAVTCVYGARALYVLHSANALAPAEQPPGLGNTAAEWNCWLNEICIVYITFRYESFVRDTSEAQHVNCTIWDVQREQEKLNVIENCNVLENYTSALFYFRWYITINWAVSTSNSE